MGIDEMKALVENDNMGFSTKKQGIKPIDCGSVYEVNIFWWFNFKTVKNRGDSVQRKRWYVRVCMRERERESRDTRYILTQRIEYAS